MIQHHVNANLVINKSNFPALFFLKCFCQLYIMQFLTCDLSCLQWMAKICCNTGKKLSINSNHFKITPVIRIFFQCIDSMDWIYDISPQKFTHLRFPHSIWKDISHNWKAYSRTRRLGKNCERWWRNISIIYKRENDMRLLFSVVVAIYIR